MDAPRTPAVLAAALLSTLVWALVGVLTASGELMPYPTYTGSGSPMPARVVALLPVLLLVTLTIDARDAPTRAARWRTAFALGTFHVVWLGALLQWQWRANDYARDLYGTFGSIVALWLVAVLVTGAALRGTDLLHGRPRVRTLVIRAAVAGAALGACAMALLAAVPRYSEQGPRSALMAVLEVVGPFMVIAAIVGAIVALALLPLDLALALLARTLARRLRWAGLRGPTR